MRYYFAGLLAAAVVLTMLTPIPGDKIQPPTPPPVSPTNTRDGSVIFWRGGLLVGPILRNTGSDITHAAIVLYDGNDEPWVYEAVPPCVRKIRLDEYEKELQTQSQKRRDFSWFSMSPRKPYTVKQLAEMKKYAESQLGRPYMLRGWWKGYEVRGVFCSQYIGNIIERSGLIVSGNVRESPGSLYRKLAKFYMKAGVAQLAEQSVCTRHVEGSIPSTGSVTGCSAVWWRTWPGTKGTEVQILSP